MGRCGDTEGIFRRLSKVCAGEGTAVALAAAAASAFNWWKANWVLICANCRGAGGSGTGRLPKLPKLLNELATGKLSNNNAKLEKGGGKKTTMTTHRDYWWLVVFTSTQNTVRMSESSLLLILTHKKIWLQSSSFCREVTWQLHVLTGERKNKQAKTNKKTKTGNKQENNTMIQETTLTFALLQGDNKRRSVRVHG